jgi:hypothetical protein
VIDSDDCHTDWLSATAIELDHLVAKIVDHTVNLLDHSFGQYLHFDTDLYSRNRPSANKIAIIEYRGLAGDDLAEGGISATGLDAAPPVLDIENAVLPLKDCLAQLRRAIDLD